MQIASEGSSEATGLRDRAVEGSGQWDDICGANILATHTNKYQLILFKARLQMQQPRKNKMNKGNKEVDLNMLAYELQLISGKSTL